VINIITIIDITTKCTWFDNTWSSLLFFILFVFDYTPKIQPIFSL